MKKYIQLATCGASQLPIMRSNGSIVNDGCYSGGSWISYNSTNGGSSSYTMDGAEGVRKLDSGLGLGVKPSSGGTRNNSWLNQWTDSQRLTATWLIKLPTLYQGDTSIEDTFQAMINIKDGIGFNMSITSGNYSNFYLKIHNQTGDEYFYDPPISDDSYFYVTADILLSTLMGDLYLDRSLVFENISFDTVVGTTKGTTTSYQYSYGEDEAYVNRLAYLNHLWIGNDLVEV